MDYLHMYLTKFEVSESKRSWLIKLHKVLETNMTLDLDLWPTNLKIIRDHLLIKDYLPTKFEASGAKPSGVLNSYFPSCFFKIQ